jgi:hypothetical protein
VFRSREGVNKKRSILRIKKKVEIEMIGDYRGRGRSQHMSKGKGLLGNYNECRSLYSFSNSAA